MSLKAGGIRRSIRMAITSAIGNNLGLLYKAKKKRALALQYFTEAKRIASEFGPTPCWRRNGAGGIGEILMRGGRTQANAGSSAGSM